VSAGGKRPRSCQDPRRGSTEKELGIDETNRLSVLAIEPGTRDYVDAWRAVFRDLKRRGLDLSYVRIGVMDGLPRLGHFFREEFCEAVTARAAGRMQCATPAPRQPERLRDAFKILADP
jgi:hypothetical protein